MMKCATCANKECYGGKDCVGDAERIKEKILASDDYELWEKASRIESEHYMELNRLEETIRLARDMGFKKVGLTEELSALLEDLSLRTISFLKALIDEGMESGEIPERADSWTTTFGLWGVIEGALYIHKRGYLENAGVSLKGLLTQQFRMLERGLKAT